MIIYGPYKRRRKILSSDSLRASIHPDSEVRRSNKDSRRLSFESVDYDNLRHSGEIINNFWLLPVHNKSHIHQYGCFKKKLSVCYAILKNISYLITKIPQTLECYLLDVCKGSSIPLRHFVLWWLSCENSVSITKIFVISLDISSSVLVRDWVVHLGTLLS